MPQAGVGIDLGTTRSCVGIWENDAVRILADNQGNHTFPSFVWFPNQGDASVGDIARKETDAVFDAKRLIGRKFDDPVVQSDMKLWPFKVVSGPNDEPLVVVKVMGEEKYFQAEQISSLVLNRMKEMAEGHLKKKVTEAVITVPVHFDESQREATKRAGASCGLTVVKLLSEPTAAAIAYGLDKKDSPLRNVLVLDMGGGTFDVSLVTVRHGIFEVKASGGDSHFGGDDFDSRVVDYCLQDFKKKNMGKDMSGNHRSLRRLRIHCERAKRMLSTGNHTTIEIDGLYDGIDYFCKLSRARFETLNVDYLMRLMDPVEECLSAAGMSKQDIDEVVLAGGSMYIPSIKAAVLEYFAGKEICESINPDEAVARGATMHAAILAQERGLNQDTDRTTTVDAKVVQRTLQAFSSSQSSPGDENMMAVAFTFEQMQELVEQNFGGSYANPVSEGGTSCEAGITNSI